MTLQQHRNASLDAARSLACLLMISQHVPIPLSPGSAAVKAVWNYVAFWSIPLFFMISGALALSKPRPLLPYVRGRLLHIALPMVVWTIVFLVTEAAAGQLAWATTVERMILIPFAPQASVFWFIYVLMGLYCLVPVAARWLEHATRREVELLLTLWGLTLLVPFVALVCGASRHLLELHQGWLFAFQGYGGMMLLGYYLWRWVVPVARWWHLALLAAACVLLPVGIYACGLPHGLAQGDATLPVTLTAAVLLVACLKSRPASLTARWATAFARRSYGVYLVHILLVHWVVFPLFRPLNIDYAFQIPLLTLFTAAAAWAIVWLIDQIPSGHYVTGTRISKTSNK